MHRIKIQMTERIFNFFFDVRCSARDPHVVRSMHTRIVKNEAVGVKAGAGADSARHLDTDMRMKLTG
jgi:hypothetical protein